MERKQIPKKIRFEVFKRDSFTCQYCGRKAPDVILECDHITPVAEGGTNDFLNLITACRDCNRGKGKILLTDAQTMEKQRDRLEELNERREQMQMLLEWKEELVNLENEQIDGVEYIMQKFTGDDDIQLTEYGRNHVLSYINRFGFEEVLSATVTSFRRYYNSTEESFEEAVNKIGGICYNRKRQGGGGA